MCSFKRIIKKLIILFKWGRKVSLCSYSNIAVTSTFEGRNYIGHNTSFRGHMGFGSYIGDNSGISANIGKYTSISSNVHVVNGFHPTSNFVSSHPAFYSPKNCLNLSYVMQNKYDEFRYVDEYKEYDVRIGNDVSVGFGSLLLGGISIGDGAIIAAGAVVTKDVLPYTIVGGVPAREIRKRFTDEEIGFLLNIQWWDKPHVWISKRAYLFNDIEAFIDAVDLDEING